MTASDWAGRRRGRPPVASRSFSKRYIGPPEGTYVVGRAAGRPTILRCPAKRRSFVPFVPLPAPTSSALDLRGRYAPGQRCAMGSRITRFSPVVAVGLVAGLTTCREQPSGPKLPPTSQAVAIMPGVPTVILSHVEPAASAAAAARSAGGVTVQAATGPVQFRRTPGEGGSWVDMARSEEHTSELQSHHDLVCRLLLEKKKKTKISHHFNQQVQVLSELADAC